MEEGAGSPASSEGGQGVLEAEEKRLEELAGLPGLQV